ncbi:MAG: TIGR04282 family arsenosugar biosynthesis glycosyltransferase [Gammaproteobacteria bacterium]
MRAEVPLILMAKAPLPGAVKTRMQPGLSAAAAAELAHVMLVRTVARARRHWRGEVVLCAAPDAAHPLFAELADEYALRLATQRGAGLGARMLAALRAGIARAGCAAVMGCDVPHCPGEALARAYELLARGENPVGPAADGGFYLLGLQCADAALFRGVDWDGGAQLRQVRARAARRGIALTELQCLRDIDRYADLEWLAAQDASYARFITPPAAPKNPAKPPAAPIKSTAPPPTAHPTTPSTPPAPRP